MWSRLFTAVGVIWIRINVLLFGGFFLGGGGFNQNTIRPQDLYSLCVACFSFATWLHQGPFALIYDILPLYPAITANAS